MILLSGGIDSSTAVAKSLEDGYALYPLLFNYGQRHSRELDSSRKIAEHYSLKVKTIQVDLTQIGGSSLTSGEEVDNHEFEDIGKSIPTTYVPSRNIIFLSMASSYAEVVGATSIIYGANSVDYSGYPDCRPEFVRAMERALNLGTKKGVESGFRIEAPLQYLTKGEIIREGLKLGVPYELTWSCYRGEEKACGKCDSCLLRLKGFMEANSVDPVDYSSYPDFYAEYIDKK